MLTGGLVAMFGSRAAGLPGAGALGCLAMPFVAALRWRQQGWTDDNVSSGNLNKWMKNRPQY